MKTTNHLIIIACLIASPLLHAESGTSQHSGQASKHSALAVSHATVDSANVASAVAAVPVSASAVLASGIAELSNKTAEVLFDLADDMSTPLIITDKVITADPAPNQLPDHSPKQVIETTEELHIIQSKKTRKNTGEQ